MATVFLAAVVPYRRFFGAATVAGTTLVWASGDEIRDSLSGAVPA